MNDSSSPYENKPPSSKRLIRGVLLAVVAAAVVLVTIVLPAEYNIDPTGIGSALGLTALNKPTETLIITEVVAGNETYKEIELPEFGDPIPLPNPAVFQAHSAPPRSQTFEINMPAESSTEIKAILETAQAIQFSWSVDRGDVYVDFHGHEPDAGDEYWVRYEEQQEGSGGNGSLVAPFAGEHGWYWLNYNDFPVVVTITISGYYTDLKDYGLF